MHIHVFAVKFTHSDYIFVVLGRLYPAHNRTANFAFICLLPSFLLANLQLTIRVYVWSEVAKTRMKIEREMSHSPKLYNETKAGSR